MNNQKENYNEDFKKALLSLPKSQKKPSLFLHACCGPCLAYPLSILIKYFNVTVGYLNPNIYPETEYLKRLEELKKLVKAFSEDSGEEIAVVSFPYDYQVYLQAVKGHEQDKEGGQRCTICHTLRLEESFKYAAENHFDYFTTVMTVSSKKPSALLNEICLALQTKYPETKYLPSDFKKEDGTLKGINISKKYHLYRQNYCGCSFSLKAREEYEKSKTGSEKDGLIG